MPIYSYRCAACGHTKDVLQKVSDPLLTECPACGAPRFEKQVTAAGFQLKGSGWYVTDFREGKKAAAAPDKPAVAAPEKPAESTAAAPAPAAAEASKGETPAAAPAAAAPPASST